MLQNLTKPPEGETAGESIQIALAASAPNDGTTASPIHTPAGSRQGSDEPVAAGAAAIHHDTTYADVVGQYLLFAASSLLGLVLLALLLKALDELLQKRLSKGIDRVAAGVLAMRRRYSSDGSRGRRRGRRASGGSRDDSRTSSTSA